MNTENKLQEKIKRLDPYWVPHFFNAIKRIKEDGDKVAQEFQLKSLIKTAELIEKHEV